MSCSLLNEQAAALRQKNVRVLGVQAAVTSDETFNALEKRQSGFVSRRTRDGKIRQNQMGLPSHRRFRG